MLPSLLRGYALVLVTGVYTGLLILSHALGRFPAPGFYDLSQLVACPVLTVQGRILNFPLTRWGKTRFLLEGVAQPLTAFSGRILVDLDFPMPYLAPDEIVRVRGWVRRPRAPGGQRIFDERTYWASQQTFCVLQVNSPEALERLAGSEHSRWTQKAWLFHQRFRSFWASRLPPAEAALVCCMTLGSRGMLPTSVKNQFIRAGVYHMLVVSGQNLALIILLGVAALQFLKIPNRYAWWICWLPIVFYSMAVGSDPPVTRAAVMALTVLILRGVGRDVPPYIPLIWAWVWVLLWNPEALFGASFQLSFGATASLLVLLPVFRKWGDEIPSGWQWVLDSLRMSLAVHLGIWPLLAYYFHQISWVGWVANLTLFPWSVIVMVGGLVLGTWGVLSPETVPFLLLKTMQASLKATLGLTAYASRWPWVVVPVDPPSWSTCLAYYGLLIGILCLHYRVKKPPRLR